MALNPVLPEFKKEKDSSTLLWNRGNLRKLAVFSEKLFKPFFNFSYESIKHCYYWCDQYLRIAL